MAILAFFIFLCVLYFFPVLFAFAIGIEIEFLDLAILFGAVMLCWFVFSSILNCFGQGVERGMSMLQPTQPNLLRRLASSISKAASKSVPPIAVSKNVKPAGSSFGTRPTTRDLFKRLNS